MNEIEVGLHLAHIAMETVNRRLEDRRDAERKATIKKVGVAGAVAAVAATAVAAVASNDSLKKKISEAKDSLQKRNK